MMESESPPLASPPPRADDAEVSSHRPSRGLEEPRGDDLTAPEGNTSAAEGLRGTAPTKAGYGDLGQSDPHPHTTSETEKAPEPNQ